MKWPKRLDKCDHPASLWLLVFNFLAYDLKQGIDTCQCCVFWRGALLVSCWWGLGALMLYLRDWQHAVLWMFFALVVIVVISLIGDKHEH